MLSLISTFQAMNLYMRQRNIKFNCPASNQAGLTVYSKRIKMTRLYNLDEGAIATPKLYPTTVELDQNNELQCEAEMTITWSMEPI